MCVAEEQMLLSLITTTSIVDGADFDECCIYWSAVLVVTLMQLSGSYNEALRCVLACLRYRG